MAGVSSDVARAVVLRHFPRVLKAGLDGSGRNGAMPAQLARDAGAIRPVLGRTVRNWLARPYLPDGRRLVHRADPVSRAVGALAVLDRFAARTDTDAIREIADAALLLGFSGHVEAAAGRAAGAVWSAMDRLPEVGAILGVLALASAGADPDGVVVPWRDFAEYDEPLPDDVPTGMEGEMDADAVKVWHDAVGAALNELRSTASVLALGLSAMASGRTLPYYADFTLAAHALAIGEAETRFVRNRAAAAVRRREASQTARSRQSIRRAAAPDPEPDEGHEHGDRPASPDASHGSVFVCPAITATGKAKDATRGYEHVIGCEVPRVTVGDLADRRTSLLAEFPYAAEAIDTVLGDLVGKEFVRLPGYLIEGPPGAGKSRFVRRLGEALGVGVYRVDATGDSGASIAGTERRWWSTEPCRPFMAIARHRHANPFLLVDEIDKAPTRSDYGRIWDALLQLVEQENASRYPDPSLQQDIDIHWVSIICLANDAGRLPGPLLDRFRVIRFPEPGPQHLEALVGASLAEIAQERGLHPCFLPPPDGVELRALRRRWQGGSVRSLRRAVEAVLRTREKLRGEPLQ